MDTAEEVELPARSTSAREARRWVTGRLVELHLDEVADEVELLTSELVTNALIHAGTTIVLRLSVVGDRVQVDVQDGSPVPPSRQHYSATATTGRGVEVLDRLAEEWGWQTGAEGKSVWFRVRRPGVTGAVPDLARVDRAG